MQILYLKSLNLLIYLLAEKKSFELHRSIYTFFSLIAFSRSFKNLFVCANVTLEIKINYICTMTNINMETSIFNFRYFR